MRRVRVLFCHGFQVPFAVAGYAIPFFPKSPRLARDPGSAPQEVDQCRCMTLRPSAIGSRPAVTRADAAETALEGAAASLVLCITLSIPIVARWEQR